MASFDSSRFAPPARRCPPALVAAATALFVAGAIAAPPGDPPPDDPVARGIALILAREEGAADAKAGGAEWPYEGVYRVKGEIPIGYRVGGTAIAATALIRAPGYAEDEQRVAAVHRAIGFIAGSIEHPDMAHEFESRYDVRGWGYAYGLAFLLEIERASLAPADLAAPIDGAIRFFVAGIEKTAIPEVGGWNYSRPRGFAAPGGPSPFMTGPTLQALFAARARGHAVNEAIVERAIGALEAARTPTGSFMYSGATGAASREPVPGSVGRMLVGESTLFLAGRSSIERVRAALDAFIVHWEWLEKRRAKDGTHAPPYGIAPYYFYFAHYHAAAAAALLPEHERREYRRRLEAIIMSTRGEDGSWNDRVFPRSAAYGTAMAVLCLLVDQAPAPDRWPPEPAAPGPGGGGVTTRP
jgi:hypothetical protein